MGDRAWDVELVSLILAFVRAEGEELNDDELLNRWDRLEGDRMMGKVDLLDEGRKDGDA